MAKRPDQTPTTKRDLEQGKPDVDISQLAELPDLLFEAAIHRSMDEVRKVSRSNPLQALDDVISLMQGLNYELLKAYGPAIIAAAQQSATLALTSKGDLNTDKAQSRALAAFSRLQEVIVKLGVAQTKTRDEIRRRERDAS